MSSNLPAVPSSSALAEYRIMEFEVDDLKEAIDLNLNGQPIAEFNLGQIRVPAGGGTTWQVPDPSAAGGIGDAKEVRGVIIHTKKQRVYFKTKFGQGENGPPSCQSDDGEMGFGVRFDHETAPSEYPCQTCPLAQFGPNGERPPCREQARLFIIREGDMLPVSLVVPPTSLKPMRDYFLSLTTGGDVYYGVVTSFTLERVAAQGSRPAFSQMKFTKVASLSREERGQMRQINPLMRQMFSRDLRSLAAGAPNGQVVEAMATDVTIEEL